MNEQKDTTAFSHAQAENEKSTESDTKPDSFGWGTFGQPPKDWPIKRVEELFEIQKISVDPDELEEDELIQLYSMPAFDKEGEPKLITAGEIGSKKFQVPNHTLLFPKLNISKKRFWLVNHNHNRPAFCSTEYWPLLSRGDLNLMFYSQYFNSDSFISKPRLSTSATTNSHQRIKSSLFDKVRLPVPPIKEQHKIASVLYTVDQAIQKRAILAEQTRRVKRGMAKKLFTEGYYEQDSFKKNGWRCKTKKIPSEWQIAPADKLMTIRRGASPRPRSDDSLFGGDIPWIKIGDANRERSQSIDAVDSYVTEKGKSKSEFVAEGSLIVANSGATCGFAIFAGLDGCVHDGWLILEDYEGFDKKYLYHYINWNYEYLRSLSLGSAQTNLSTNLFGRLDIPKPTIQEQRKIADTLDSFDKQQYQYLNERDKLENLKRGLKQDLLSGEVRTHDKNIEIVDEVLQHG